MIRSFFKKLPLIKLCVLQFDIEILHPPKMRLVNESCNSNNIYYCQYDDATKYS